MLHMLIRNNILTQFILNSLDFFYSGVENVIFFEKPDSTTYLRQLPPSSQVFS